jgi:ABC-type dipeptide/oligopeptide/nickel transport system permease subunit
LPAAVETPPVAAVPIRRRRLLGNPRIAIPAGVVLLVLLVAAVPGLFASADPRACDLADSGVGPVSGHPFGFDIQGCDLYSNVVYGTRSSVIIGFTVTAGCVLIALVLGCLAAYYRGAVDAVVSRTMDIFFGFPALVGQVVILNTLHQRNVVVVSAVLILFAWPAMTRLMRSAALATVDLDFVKAARGLGAGPVRVIVRHVLPNSFAPILAVASLGIGGMITAESALTFLGVGLRAPSISWGVQLNQAQDSFRDHPHLLLFPSLFLSVTVLAFVMLGDALRDAFDPRSR